MCDVGFHCAVASNMLRFGAYQDDLAGFDAGAFRLARGEAVALDPQARVLLHQVANARQVCCPPRLLPMNPSDAGTIRSHVVLRCAAECQPDYTKALLAQVCATSLSSDGGRGMHRL